MVLGYRTILTVLGVNDPEDDLNNAIVTAQAVDAHLSVVVIAIPAPPPFGASAEMISAVRLEERQGDMAKLTERTKQVEEQLASSGLSFDVQDLYTESAWADGDRRESALRRSYAYRPLRCPRWRTLSTDRQRHLVPGARSLAFDLH